MAKVGPIPSTALLDRLVALCHEKKVEDLVALDVRDLVDYVDFLVVATARSDRQARAAAAHVLTTLKQEGTFPLSVAGLESGGWVCVDLVDVILHLFTPELRAHYDLELLWADAPRLPLAPG